MRIYKKIEIESSTWQKICIEINNLDIDLYKDNFNYVETGKLKNQCMTLFNWMYNINLTPLKSAIIITKPHLYNSTPHVDAQINSLALNFPIKNCIESETVFYTTMSPLETETLKKPNGANYKALKNRDWVEVGKYILDTPTIINTHIPHRIINRGSHERLALSIRFDRDPWELFE